MTPRAEFKRKAVDLVRSGVRIQRAADQLGIPNGTLWNWVEEAGLPVPHGETAEARHRDTVDVETYLAAVNRIAELERENETLVKAAALFARRVPQ